MTIDWQRLAPPLAAAIVAAVVWRRAATAADRPKSTPGTSSAGNPLAALPLVAGAAAGLWLWRSLGKPWLAFAAFAFGYGMTTLWRAVERQRAEAAAETEAFVAIGAANRALRAGLPLLEVLATAAGEAAGEARAALREILHRERLGDDLAAAVRKVMRTVRQPELRAFGMALAVNQEVGGNLVATSERLTRALVDRSRTRRRARTIVAYSRTAALALAVLPFVAVTMLARLLPGYLDFLLGTNGGNAMVAIASALLVLGLRSIQRMAQVDAAPTPQVAR
jgi:Flp pilus assembly protein TadB